MPPVLKVGKANLYFDAKGAAKAETPLLLLTRQGLPDEPRMDSPITAQRIAHPITAKPAGQAWQRVGHPTPTPTASGSGLPSRAAAAPRRSSIAMSAALLRSFEAISACLMPNLACTSAMLIRSRIASSAIA